MGVWVKNKTPGKLYSLEEYRQKILVPASCTMKDCQFKGEVSVPVNGSIDRVNCPKCVNQSLELVYRP
jgi:hypothetical protein